MKFDRCVQSIIKYRYHVIGLMSVFFVVALFLIYSNNAMLDDNDDLPSDNDDPIIELPQPIKRSMISGAPYEEELYELFSVLIENSASARPQSGIGQADIVYEISVESYSITRFLAIFHSQVPNKIGPVRSVRMPFANYAKEWMIPFAHYGGAKRPEADAYSVVREAGFPTRFDGVSGLNNKYFFRDSARRAPHNAYFMGEDALEIIQPQMLKQAFLFDESSNIIGEQVTSLILKYGNSQEVRYQYHAPTQRYLRYMGESPFLDAIDNQQVTVKNIILQHAKHTTVGSVGYVMVEDVGSGVAEYFIEGIYHKGYWEKSDDEDVTRFFLDDGEPLKLAPGNTWIQLVSHRVFVSYN